MSYLVDALKKAERERHAQRHSDLRSAASVSSDAAGSSVARALYAVVAVLVVFNIGLLAYLWWPSHARNTEPVSAATSAPTEPALPEAAAPTTTEHQDTRAAASGTSRPAGAGPAPATSGDDAVTGRPVENMHLSDQYPDADPSTTAGDDSGIASGSGSVSYSKTPLDGTADASSTGRPSPQESESSGQGPPVAINGQLYSSVPGRSFILVDGVRYHEGERLPTGPAIESIDPDGATLIYQGQRYHVRGPG